MKNILPFLLVVLLPFAMAGCKPSEAQSTTDTLTWSHPAQRVDSSALALSEIRDTTIAWGPSGGPYTDGSVVVPAPAATVAVPRPSTPGTRCYVAMTTTTDNKSSVFTNQVCKTLTANPRPPTNLQVQ